MMKATSCRLMFEGVELQGVASNDNRAVKSSEETLLTKLRERMNDRFGDVSAGVLRANELASFRNWTDPENAAGLFRMSEHHILYITQNELINIFVTILGQAG